MNWIRLRVCEAWISIKYYCNKFLFEQIFFNYFRSDPDSDPCIFGGSRSGSVFLKSLDPDLYPDVFPAWSRIRSSYRWVGSGSGSGQAARIRNPDKYTDRQIETDRKAGGHTERQRHIETKSLKTTLLDLTKVIRLYRLNNKGVSSTIENLSILRIFEFSKSPKKFLHFFK